MKDNKVEATAESVEEEVQVEEETVEEVKEEKSDKKPKLFTRDELNKILAAEKAKTAEEVAEKKDLEYQEAEKLKNMTAEQKAKEIQKKQQKEFEQQRKELNLGLMKLEAIKIMNEKGLPIEMVDFVVAETADETTEKIEKLEEAFRISVEEHTEKKLKGSTPKETKKQEPVDPFMKGFDEA